LKFWARLQLDYRLQHSPS